MQQTIQSLPNSVPKLKEIATRLIYENSQLRNDITVEERKITMAKQSMAELQSVAENPLFEQSLLSEQNKELHVQLERMMHTEKEARERIIGLEKRIVQQKEEFEAEILTMQKESLQQVGTATQLNAIIENEKIQLQSFFLSICSCLSIRERDNIEQAELEVIGEVEQLRQVLQIREGELYSLQQKEEDFYDEKETLLNEIAELHNNEVDQQKMDVIEHELVDLQAIMEKLQTENNQLHEGNKEEYELIAQEKEQIETLENELRSYELSAHLIGPMDEEITRMKTEIESKNANIRLLEEENQEIKEQIEILQHSTKSAVVHQDNVKFGTNPNKGSDVYEIMANMSESLATNRTDQKLEMVANKSQEMLLLNSLESKTMPEEQHSKVCSYLASSSVQIQTDAATMSMSLDKIVSEMLTTSENEDRLRISGSLNEFEDKSEEDESESNLGPMRFSTQTQKTELNVADYLAEHHKELFNRVMEKRLLKEQK